MTILGYLITFHTYGSWLHGRGTTSVDSEHNQPGEPFAPSSAFRVARNRELMKHPEFSLNAEARWVVDSTIREVCSHRGWRLLAVHPRTTHVHVVVDAAHTPERCMGDFKAYCTRRLAEAGLVERGRTVWSYHGSTRYLSSPESVLRAIEYVMHEQGETLEVRRPGGQSATLPADP